MPATPRVEEVPLARVWDWACGCQSSVVVAQGIFINPCVARAHDYTPDLENLAALEDQILIRSLPLLLLALPVVCIAGAAPANVAQRADVTLTLANKLVSAALASCHAEGRRGVAAVVDRGGNLVALQRDDNVGPHNTRAAQRKAFTALSTKSATSALAESARTHPESNNLNTVDELLLLGGGLPLRAGDQVIGAIGMAGAGGSAMDEGCAQKAIDDALPISH